MRRPAPARWVASSARSRKVRRSDGEDWRWRPPPARSGDAHDGEGRRGARARPIRARIDFAALALFAASVPTDANGSAQVPVKLPDNLTRYRVMAVAAAGATAVRLGRERRSPRACR